MVAIWLPLGTCFKSCIYAANILVFILQSVYLSWGGCWTGLKFPKPPPQVRHSHVWDERNRPCPGLIVETHWGTSGKHISRQPLFSRFRMGARNILLTSYQLILMLREVGEVWGKICDHKLLKELIKKAGHLKQGLVGRGVTSQRSS